MDVPELIPIDEYNPVQARLESSIKWLLTKAYGDNIPCDLEDPFYTDRQHQVCVKHEVISGLVSADLYSRACEKLFSQLKQKWTGHMSVMQALSRQGVYVMDSRQSAVTEAVLAQSSPFQLDAHLSLIEALLVAHTKETVTVERVVQAVRKFTSFTASSELPYDVEDALLFWMNKVCGVVRHRIQTQNRGAGEAGHRSRGNSVSSSVSGQIPVLDDLLKDLSDGCCLATLISFYCPIALRTHDIAVSESLGIADSLYNLQLVSDFCEDKLPAKVLHLTLNDLFYTPPLLKPQVLSLLAELFYHFELSRAACVEDVSKHLLMDNGATKENQGVEVSSQKAARTPTHPSSVPISGATKRSFQTPDGIIQVVSYGSMTDLSSGGSNMPPTRQPLLPKRLHEKNKGNPYRDSEKVRRSRSFNSAGDREMRVHSSSHAWGEGDVDGTANTTADTQKYGNRAKMSPQNPHSRASQQSSFTNVTNSNLLSNVSIDTEASLDISTDTSVTLSELDMSSNSFALGHQPGGSVSSRGPVVNAGDMEVESVTPGGNTIRSTSKSNPHKLTSNPGNNPHSNNPHPATAKSEPLQPAKMKPAKEKINNGHSKDFESGESQQQKKSPSSPTKPARLAAFRDTSNATGSGGDESPSDSEYLTPSTEVGGFGYDFPPQGGATEPLSPKRHKAGGTAFFVDTQAGLTTSTPRSGRSNAQSFTVEGQGYTEESAKAAGIPVVAGSQEYNLRHVGSPRGSSDGSDQELRKIHADHRENEGKAQSFFVTANGDMVSRPDSLNISRKGPHSSKSHKDSLPSPKTSFAELSQKKGSETSPERTSTTSTQGSLSLKEQFEKARNARTSKKTTTFAALPNQTTWQETAKKSAMSPGEASKSPEKSSNAGIPSGSELLDVRLRLEERRRQIENEKRKMELQWDRQRQTVGKKAFMQVIHKNKEAPEPSSSSKVNPKVIPKTIPEHKEISPGSPKHSTRSPATRASPSRNKVSRSQSERLSPSQRSSVHLKKPLASEAEDRLQHVMHRLDGMDMGGTRGGSHSHHHTGQLEQDSLTNMSSKQGERKQSPAAQRDKPAVRKQFSREDIQNKIDGVKQRWFSEEGTGGGAGGAKRATSTPPRPTSAQAGKGKVSESESKTRRGSDDALPTHISSSYTAGQTDRPGSAAVGETREYSSSLDKLNTSLTDLQGEIMRLSLQQDQIKSLVKEEKRSSPTPEKKSSSGKPGQGHKESAQEASKFYLYPREGEAGEPDLGGEPRSQVQGQAAPPSHAPPQVHPAPPQSHPAPPQGHAGVSQGQVVVGVPSNGQYGTSQQYGMAPQGNYPPPPQQYVGPPHMGAAPVYPGIPPPYVPQYNHTSPQHGYIYPPGVAGLPPNTGQYQGGGASMWGGGGAHSSPSHVQAGPGYHIPHTYATAPHHHQPLPHQPPPHHVGAPTMTVTAQNTVNSPTAGPPSFSSPGARNHYQRHDTMATSSESAVQSPVHSSSHQRSYANSPAQSPPHSIPQSPAAGSGFKRQSPARHATPSPEKTLRGASINTVTSPVHSEGSGSVEGEMRPLEPIPSPPVEEPDTSQGQQGEAAEGEQGGYYFAFETSSGPVKPKPQLGRDRKKKVEQNGIKVPSSNTVTSPYEHHAEEEEEEPVPSGSGLVSAGLRTDFEEMNDRSASPYTVPPEAFVVGIEDEPMDNSDLSELELRKVKFMALQNKRREEENRRKKKLEEERAKKKEEHRQKEEMSGRKKADEKQRRDQIFQEYLKRKEERETEEELARAGMAPVSKRNKPKPKTPNRPKSQPPSSLQMDKNPASSHSSQEDLRPRGRSPAHDRHRKGLSVHESPTKQTREQLFSGDHPDSGQMGSLAYGGLTHRRPPTPDKGRPPPGYGDQANNNNTDHGGLKLFKKMSSKSNKPVISQAISHCCLAGTVNNDMKKRVLETLTNAEANHFLILFRDAGMQYRGLYTYNLETEEIYKVSGVGPRQITSNMMNGFYKYNSGAKHFSQITTTKHMSATVDALTLQNACWSKKKPEKRPPAGQY